MENALSAMDSLVYSESSIVFVWVLHPLPHIPTMFKLSVVQVWALISMSISALAASISPQYSVVVETRGTVSLSLLYFIQESFSILFYSKNATVNVDICTGNPSTGCVEILINLGNFINLDGGLVFFNKQISSAIIPTGLCKDCLHIFRVSSTFHILPL